MSQARNFHTISSAKISRMLPKGVEELANALSPEDKDSLVGYLCARYGIKKRKYSELSTTDLWMFWSFLDDRESGKPWDSEAKIASIALISLLRKRGIVCDTIKCLNPPECKIGRIPELTTKYKSYYE